MGEPKLVSWKMSKLLARQVEFADWMEAAKKVVDTILTDGEIVGETVSPKLPDELVSSITSISSLPTPTSNSITETITAAVTAAVTTASPSAGPQVHEKRTDTLAIILGVIFGVVAILLISLLAFLCIRRRRRHGSFIYQDNVSVASADSFVGTATTGNTATNQKDVSTASSSPERVPTFPVGRISSEIGEKTTPGRISPPSMLGRISPSNTLNTSPRSSKVDLVGYPPIPAPHQISSLGRRHSSDYAYHEYAYVPNDPFNDTNQAIYSQHLHQQHMHQQQNRSRSRASLTTNPSTTLEPLREYPEHNEFREPRNPLPRDPRENALYNYRNSYRDSRDGTRQYGSYHEPRMSPNVDRTYHDQRMSPSADHTYREPRISSLSSSPESNKHHSPRFSSSPHQDNGRMPPTSATPNLPISHLWPQPPKPIWSHASPKPIKHSNPTWPWPSNHPAAMGLGLILKTQHRAPEMLRYKRNGRRWTSEPYLLANQSKMLTRKPVPLPRTTPIPPLEKVRLPEFWWEQKHTENNASVEDIVLRREPLRRFSFESRPEG